LRSSRESANGGLDAPDRDCAAGSEERIGRNRETDPEIHVKSKPSITHPWNQLNSNRVARVQLAQGFGHEPTIKRGYDRRRDIGRRAPAEERREVDVESAKPIG